MTQVQPPWEQLMAEMKNISALAEIVAKHDRALYGSNGDKGIVANVLDIKDDVEVNTHLLIGTDDKNDIGIKGEMANIRRSVGNAVKLTWIAVGAAVSFWIAQLLQH